MNIRKRVYEGKEKSDSDWKKEYQVYLFNNGQGVCSCPDFHNRGVVAGNLDYKCKHVVRSIVKYQESIRPQLLRTETSSDARRIEVFAGQNDKLYLVATDLNTGVYGRAARVSEDEIMEAFKKAREVLRAERAGPRFI